MICASLNCANFSSAPLNSFHLTFVQSGGVPRNQLLMSFHLKPLPSAFLASDSASRWIRLWLKEAEGSSAFCNLTLLNSTPEKFGAYNLNPGTGMFANLGVPEKS